MLRLILPRFILMVAGQNLSTVHVHTPLDYGEALCDRKK